MYPVCCGNCCLFIRHMNIGVCVANHKYVDPDEDNVCNYFGWTCIPRHVINHSFYKKKYDLK